MSITWRYVLRRVVLTLIMNVQTFKARDMRRSSSTPSARLNVRWISMGILCWARS
ncbi:hypothetical protein IEO21_04169 [Rhodonia placenta]|uniref:Uncharacterized protein n=1 Tax=Rhodonia placenta TaxID=104341 RepID=A0A8H7U3G4_9APHY|nr:hypothetical protein IEO21_04169 [Postia placenta]